MNSILTAPENRELIATFTVKGEPISKARARFTKRGSKVVSYTPQKTLDGEAAIAAAYLEVINKKSIDEEATYAVHAHFVNGTRQRRDVDNMVKLILDGLNEVAWPDDNQVTEIAAKKSWATKAEARTEVTIYRIGVMNRPSAPCLLCGEPFRVYQSTREAKYCSIACGNKHRAGKKTRTCAYCSESFQAWGESKETRYCSKECSYLGRRTVANCAICNSEFTIQNCHLKERNYCSDECRREQDRITHKERRSKYFPGTCIHCGGGTTRKEYTRCMPCKRRGILGAPQRKGPAGVTLTITELEDQ